MRIAWLTDIHLNFLNWSRRIQFYNRILKEKPDVVLMRGDIVFPYDGQVLVDDLVFLVDYLFNSGDAPECPAHGDVAEPLDGKIFVDDIVLLVDYLFSEAWIPEC